jgi:O-antigen/teichoic acid export membrane protein
VATTSARRSLALNAAWVLLLNGLSNLLLLAGTTYAARCLGATNVGIGAQVQAAVQQAALASNGGFDPVAVRAIASGRRAAPWVVRVVLCFRLGIAAPLALGWVVFVLATQPPGAVRNAWLLGAALLVLGSAQLQFLFQAVERLPIYTGIAAAMSLLTALSFRMFFVPGMPAGSDLLVLALVGLIALASMFFMASRVVQLEPGMPKPDIASAWRGAGDLMRESWRYWALAVLAFVYTGLPVLLVAFYQGDAAAGVFRMSLLFAGAMEVMFGSINSLLPPRLIRWRDEGEDALWSAQRRLVSVHLSVGILATAFAIAAAPWCFATFLGPEFQAGIPVFQVLGLSRLIVFVGQIYAFGLTAQHLDQLLLRATIWGALTSVAVNVLLIPRMSLLGAAVAAVASEVVVVGLCFAFSLAHRRRSALLPRSGM